MSGDIVIQAEHVSKLYRLGVINHGTLYRDLQSWWAKFRGRPDPNAPLAGAGWTYSNTRMQGDRFQALDDVSFKVQRGDIVGIIGGNGAGKSTLLKVLSRITAPTIGYVGLKGRVSSLLEVGTGFHPELTGRENVHLNGAILGMTRREVARKFDEIVAFAEVGQFIDTPVKRYSSGMYVRLAFSVAAHLESEILLVDEVLAVGDISFQRKCLGKMEDIRSSGRTILFVSHNMASIENLCSSALVLKDGRVDFYGDTKEGIRHYHALFEGSSAPAFEPNTRTGDGRVRISDAWFEDREGRRMSALRSGESVRLCISIDCKADNCRNLVVAAGVTTLHGEGILHFSTETSGLVIPNFSNHGLFTCTVPKLPLRAGYYSLNLFITSNGAIADWLLGALKFQIEDADFYGTGKLPPEGYPLFLAEYSWSYRAN